MAIAATRIRTICYIDGFNLYYGLRESGLRHCYWLNVREMAASLVKLPHVLSGTKYFTARVSGTHPHDDAIKAAERQASRLRQQTFLETLATLKALEIFEGRYLLKRDHCRQCNADFYRAEEKMTDVRIATEMVADAFLDRFDSAMLVSADGDLVPPVLTVKRHFPHKRIVVAFPPNRFSFHLSQVADATLKVWPRTLERCQFPDEVRKADGTILRRPAQWV